MLHKRKRWVLKALNNVEDSQQYFDVVDSHHPKDVIVTLAYIEHRKQYRVKDHPEYGRYDTPTEIVEAYLERQAAVSHDGTSEV